MLNQSIVMILTILFSWYGVGSAIDDGSDKVGDSKVLLFSDSSRLNGNIPEFQTSGPGTNKSQNPSGFKPNSPLEYSNLPWDSNDPTVRYEPFNELLAATPTIRVLSDFFEVSANETESRNLVEISDLRASPLFITEAMKKGPNRIPQSSTLMLLGLVLVGLAGYGGRKRFKR